jgi:hypothetical protein
MPAPAIVRTTAARSWNAPSQTTIFSPTRPGTYAPVERNPRGPNVKT